MLTGRMQAYTDHAHYDDVTGFTDPKENPTYDLFSIGHTSTALALASGLAKARDIEGLKHNVIAVVGDGALGGGEALEGLDYGATLGTNFIVVVNDNSRIAVLTAGTPGAIGFYPERRKEAGSRFIDVGIAEQMAVGMTAGLAKAGIRPVFAVVSSFMQRAYDQVSQDVAINGMPSVFVIFHTGVFAMNDETHLGFFDIAMLGNIPDVNFLAPASRQEYLAMLDWAVKQTSQPVVVRTPGGAPVDDPAREILDDYSAPRYEIARHGSRVALIGAGNFFYRMRQAADILQKDGITPTLINPRCLSALDTETLDTLRDYDTVITAEDGIVDGGFGQKVAAYLSCFGTRVHCLGLPKEFLNEYVAADVVKAAGLEPEQIAALARQ